MWDLGCGIAEYHILDCGLRIWDIFHQKAFHIPIPVINIDPIRQEQILLHPSFELARFASDIDSALKDAILLQESAVKQHHKDVPCSILLYFILKNIFITFSP